jgi:hypothetical protein
MGHERQAIVDQELGALVREFVRRLNDESLEHRHRIEWRTPALRTIGISERRVQVRAGTSRNPPPHGTPPADRQDHSAASNDHRHRKTQADLARNHLRPIRHQGIRNNPN